ncbi:MAG: tyrosine-type recombinase/integrase [Pseudomonadota bacterium]
MLQKNEQRFMYIDIFTEYLIGECGFSVNTLKSYTYDIKQFLKQDKSILDYISSLKTTKRSLARKISTLKTYHEFLFSEKIINKNPMAKIPTPKYDIKLPRPLPANDIKKIIQYAQNDLRLLSMLQLLYSTGMRISEMLSLKNKNLIYDTNKIRSNFIIQSKGNKERIIITNQHTISVLEKYYNKIHTKKSIFFFPSNSKQGYITRQNFHKTLNKIAKHCNIPTFSAHQLRHSFATTLLNNGANIILIKSLLGHSSINTTKIYTHVNQENIKKAIINNHPLSKN